MTTFHFNLITYFYLTTYFAEFGIDLFLHFVHRLLFIQNANRRTLFFIDELGSGSDPNLGGAFAEVILLELAKKHAIGIVTTHYLNLKVMAGKTAGIINGAMAFDEKLLQPQYKLIIGKPGSSYTFSIADQDTTGFIKSYRNGYRGLLRFLIIEIQ